MQKLEIVTLLNFQDKLQTRKQSCISISSICVTVLLIVHIYTKFPFEVETTVFCAVLSKTISSDVRNLFLSENLLSKI